MPRKKKVRTDREIVDQTNELARRLYEDQGYAVPTGYRFDQAEHPHERAAWNWACIAMVYLTETDPEDALIALEDDK